MDEKTGPTTTTGAISGTATTTIKTISDANTSTATNIEFDNLVTSLGHLEESGALAREFARLPTSSLFPSVIGKSQRVAKKNRWKEVVPYDHNRVILTIPNVSVVDEEQDYINASFIRGSTSNEGFISTQGPMLGTVDDFWNMVWSEKSNLVVMLCRLVENYQNQSYKYWPDAGDCLDVDDVIITNNMEDERGTYVLRKISLRHCKTGEERQVNHLQFLAWPDNSLPCLPIFIQFWKVFRSLKNTSTGLPIIHCSNGSRRTCLLIGLENLMTQSQGTTSVDVFTCTLRLLEDRVECFTTENDYVYLFKLTVEAYLSRKSKSFLEKNISDLEPENGNNLYTRDQELELQTNNILEEFKVLDHLRRKTKVENDPLLANTNSNKDYRDMKKDLLTGTNRLQFPQDTGSVFVTCVPLNHQTVRRSHEQRPSRLRHSVSLQENEMFLGISGVLPCECKSSFLVTSTPNSSQQIDFWQMIFDTGCRTVIRLVESDQPLILKEKFPLQTPDFNISVAAQTTLREPINETTLSLSCETESVIPLDGDVPSTTAIKVLSLAWSRNGHVRPSCDTLFLLVNILTKWLHQTSTSLVAVHCRDGWSVSGPFCSTFNSIASLKMDKRVDVYLEARIVQSFLPLAISQDEYQYLHRACNQYLDHYHQNHNRLVKDLPHVSLSDHQQSLSTSSDQ